MDVRHKREALWTRAVAIFGSEVKPESWFHTRLSELAGRTPEEVLDEDPDSDAVVAVLERIEYGVFN